MQRLILTESGYTSQPATWQQAMQAVAKQTQRTVAAVLEEQAQLLAVDLLKMTPPTSSKGVFSEGGLRQRKRGHKTVEADVKRLFVGPERYYQKWSHSKAGPYIRKYIDTQDMEKLSTVFKRTNYNMGVTAFEGMATEELHQRALDPSTGQPRKNVRILVMNEKSIEPVIKLMQSRVGHGKSGWLTALRVLNRKLPSGYGWVPGASRQSGGYVARDKSPDTPSITIANAAPHGSNLLKLKSGESLIDKAIKLRASKMLTRLAYTMRQPKGATA